MRKVIIAVLTVAIIVLTVSCGMIDESLIGTWSSKTDRRILSYTFNDDGTFRYVLKDLSSNRTITDISGTWEINADGLLHMNAPITNYVSRFNDFPRFVLIHTEEPYVMCFCGADDPDYIDESFYKPYTVVAENSYSYTEKTESNQYGVMMTNDSTYLFEFDPANEKCVMTVTEDMDYENGTHCKSTKKYNCKAEDYSCISFIGYRLTEDMMFEEDELFNYTISGKMLLLANLNVLLTKE